MSQGNNFATWDPLPPLKQKTLTKLHELYNRFSYSQFVMNQDLWSILGP